MPRKRPNPKPTPIGRWLQVVRAINGIEQDVLADRICKSRSAVSAYERGTRTVPGEVVDAILRSFPNAPAPPHSYPATQEAEITLDAPIRRFELPYFGTAPARSPQKPVMRPVDPKFVGADRFIRRIGGNSAAPALLASDETVWLWDNDPDPGVIVLVESPDSEEVAVMVLAWDDELAGNVPRSINPEYPNPPCDWKPIARLIGVVRTKDGPELSAFWLPGLRPEHLTKL